MHELGWCAQCKPPTANAGSARSAARAQPEPKATTNKEPKATSDKGNPAAQRKPRRGRVWVPPPKTPHPYWDAVEARPVAAAPPLSTRRIQRWQLDRDLRKWQTDALTAWEANGRRGVIEAATGTGKTMVAMAAVSRVRSDHGVRGRFAVVVPTQALASQWVRELRSVLDIDPSLIAEEHSAAPSPPSQPHVVVTVINTARTRLAERIADWESAGNRVLVVVDECHRAGSEHNSAVLTTEASYSLGLSATPERTDGAHEQRIYPGIGDPVYRYPLLKALDDEVLAPLRSVNLYVDLTTGERGQWEGVGRDLGIALATLESQNPGITADPIQMWATISRLARLDDPAAKRVVALVAERRSLLSNSTERRRCTDAVLDWMVARGERAMVFHESIESAELVAEGLRERGAAVVLDHSELPRAERTRSLDRFRRNTATYLVAVRSLDEGIDVPDAAVAVIAAGSRSPRQRIQRLGRILRASEGKSALAVSILVRATPEEEFVGRADGDILGAHRVAHHRWPGRSVADAIASPSSYGPSGASRDRIDELTAASLGVAGVMRATASPASTRTKGGYGAKAQSFSPNAWHAVADVRLAAGMPGHEFDRLRPKVRTAFRSSLDQRYVDDTELIHGTEIEAIVRQWKTHRGRR